MAKTAFIAAAAMLVYLSLATASRADDTTEITAVENRLLEAFLARDVNAVMAYYAPNVFMFDDNGPPRQYVGSEAVRKNLEGFFAGFPGPLQSDTSELSVDSDGTLGFAHYIQHLVFTDKNGKQYRATQRWTDVFRKIDGKWLIVHEHGSVPYNYAAGKADLSSSM